MNIHIIRSFLLILFTFFVHPLFITALEFEIKARITEEQFFDKWQNNPSELYVELIQRRQVAELHDDPFQFPEMLATVMKIKNDIENRLSNHNELQSLTNEEINCLEKYSDQFQLIINDHIPYDKTIVTIFSYLEFMDDVFKRLCPTLPNSLAKMNTERFFSNLSSQKNLFLLFSFRPSDITFFIKSRPAPIYIIGLMDYPSFEKACEAKVKTDGLMIEIGGFSHHDAEHTRGLWKTDSDLSRKSNHEKLVVESQMIRNLMTNRIKQLEIKDPDLAQAATILLFELLHERGLQFNLGLLKTYLNIPIYLETTKRKWKTLFWDPLPGKVELYSRFDEAFDWLNRQVSDLLIFQNKECVANGNYQFFTLDKVSLHEGFVDKMEILDEDDVKVCFTNSPHPSLWDERITTSIHNTSTFASVIKTFGDINSTSADFVKLPGKSSFLQVKFNHLLKLQNAQLSVSYRMIENGHLIHDQFIGFNENNKTAIFKNYQGETYSLPIDTLVVTPLKNKNSIISQTIDIEHISLPLAGIGTHKLEPNRLVNALKNGFKLIDTAKAYGNEEDIGAAIKTTGIDPNSLMIITKLFQPNLESKDTIREAIFDSIQKIGKIPDLILIHAPYPSVPMLSLVNELQIMKKEGIIKEWGVSNFDIEHLKFLAENGFTPLLNQVEFHPFFQRSQLLDYCKKHNILFQAYRPLAQGKALTNPVIESIATLHNVSPATLIYSWLAQQGIAIVTKVSSNEHQQEYAESGQIHLTEEEIQSIAHLHLSEEKGRTCTTGGWCIPFTSDIRNKWSTR